MMTPDRLTVELGRRMDGPHSDEHTNAAAELAAEAARFLAYATGPHASEGLTEPATAYAVLGQLAQAAHRLMPVFHNLSVWLASSHAAGQLAADDGQPAAERVTAARRELEDAYLRASQLGNALAAAQSAVSALHTIPGGAR